VSHLSSGQKRGEFETSGTDVAPLSVIAWPTVRAARNHSRKEHVEAAVRYAVFESIHRINPSLR
jgi:hypothetical protein